MRLELAKVLRPRDVSDSFRKLRKEALKNSQKALETHLADRRKALTSDRAWTTNQSVCYWTRVVQEWQYWIPKR